MKRDIITGYIFWTLVISLIAILAIKYIPERSNLFYVQLYFRHNIPQPFWVFGNFDGAHYTDISRLGYRPLEQGFFPLFPGLIAVANNYVKIPHLYAGLLISRLSFLFALFVTYKLLKLDKYSKIAPLVIGLLLFFPSSYYYGSVYNDSLFFLLASLTLYFGRKKQFWYASICGALATLARLNGLALFFFLAAEYITQKDRKPLLSSGIISILFIPCAFVGYLAYIQNRFGSFTTLFSSMKTWNQNQLTFPPVVFWRYIKIIVLHPQFHEVSYWVAFLEFTFVIFYLAMLWYSFRKIRHSYWIFFALSLLIPMLTGTFQGMPRYGLHLYPLFLTVGMLLHKRKAPFKILYFVITFSLLFIMLSMFVRGYFVA